VSSLPAASFAALALVSVGSVRSAPDRHSLRCDLGSTQAVIGGRKVCLVEGNQCHRRFERQYRRYLYTCPTGTLRIYWAGLRRPFKAQPISAGDECPSATTTGPLSARGIVAPLGAAPAWGPGPAYPTALGRGPRPEFIFEYPPPQGSGWEGSGWGGNKNIWVISPSYRGPVLVRGHQLDGPNEVRFENGRPAFTQESGLHPSPELRLRGPETYGNPSTTRLRAAGCYTFQVDGRGFSYPIVFEARLQAGP